MLTEVFIDKYKQGIMSARERLIHDGIIKIIKDGFYYDKRDNVYKYVHITTDSGAVVSIIPILRIHDEDYLDDSKVADIIQSHIDN